MILEPMGSRFSFIRMNSTRRVYWAIREGRSVRPRYYERQCIPLKSTADTLAKVVNSAYPRLLAISEALASEKPYSEKWSFKGVLGHLIDSAANNHQRIVRMQETPHIGTLRYSQEHWVSVQHYESEAWNELVELWYRFNLHLIHVITHVDPETLENLCDVGDSQPASLKLVIQDYVRHVEHHLKQILSGVGPRDRELWK